MCIDCNVCARCTLDYVTLSTAISATVHKKLRRVQIRLNGKVKSYLILKIEEFCSSIFSNILNFVGE